MEDFSAFTSGERALFGALVRRGVRFMIVDLGAAVLRAPTPQQGTSTSGWRTRPTLLRVLRLDRIIASKRAAKRTKDLAVLPALEEALAALEEPPP